MPRSLKIKKNLLVVLLGGTIGSVRDEEGNVELADRGFDAEFFEALDRRFKYKVISPVTYSSENADIGIYKKAIGGILEEAGRTGASYKGILILHGTDSMAYFAQLAVRCLSYLKIPVIITGSKKTKNEQGTDVVKNISLSLGLLAAAIKDGSGARTFGVVFEDSYTHKSTYVDSCASVNADINGDMGSFVDRSSDESGKFSKKAKSPFATDEYKKRTRDFIARDTGRIMVIPAIPGSYIPKDTDDCNALVIECYHSGTQDDKALLPLISSAKDRNIPVIMGPVPTKGNIYTSRRALEDAGAMVMSGFPFEGIWAEAVIDWA
ncbi:MAG: asparaginase [Clostridiales bacterium]|nr:asparaginase [Clostridiales bacterium]